MNYTQEQFSKATPITALEYCKMENMTFEGQTRVNSNDEYKTYWSNESGELFVITSKL